MMSPAAALSFLIGINKGGAAGSAVSAILLNVPGEPSSVVTTYDGYPMAQKGQAGKALAIAAYSSFSGGTIAALFLLIAAPMLASVPLSKLKPGSEQQFVEEHRKLRSSFKGFLGGSLISTGERTFCMIGEWRNFKSLVAARPEMIAVLDRLRDMLEDLGGGLGVTDPLSGEAVVRLAATKSAKKRTARAPRAKKRASAKRSRARR